MSDMKKKIGKQGLDGLLNRKEPERPQIGSGHRSKFKDNPNYDPYTNSWRGTDSYRSAYDGPRGISKRSGGNVSPGRVAAYGGNVKFFEEDGLAVIHESEIRRLRLELGDLLINALRTRNIGLGIGAESEVHAMISTLIETDGRVAHKGKLLKVCIEEDE
jgi:hypothetical protein